VAGQLVQLLQLLVVQPISQLVMEGLQLTSEARIVASLVTGIFFAWIFLLMDLLTSSVCSGVILSPVHWNSSNPM